MPWRPTRFHRTFDNSSIAAKDATTCAARFPDPGEKQRMKEVNREIRKPCKGTDRQLAKLKKKYAGNEPVMQRLREFEPRIESDALH